MINVRNHIKVLLSGNIGYYCYTLRRRWTQAKIALSPRRELIFSPYPGVKATLHPRDDLNLRVYLSGLDKLILETLENYLRPGMVVVDVGAHTGLYTLVCASLVGPLGRVYAFEPVPWLEKRIRDHARLNGLCNIESFNLALSARSGRAPLYLSAMGGDAWASLYRWDWTCNKAIEVDVMTIDEWAQKYEIKSIDLLKIDVEGAELQVLLGAQHTLEAVKAVLIEYNKLTYAASGISIREIRDFLLKFEFRWYALPWKPFSRKSVNWANLGELCDLIAIREGATW